MYTVQACHLKLQCIFIGMPYESSEDPSNLYTRNQLIQTRPDHITTRPVCHSDFYTVHLHAMTTLTILSTPTKLTNLTTLINKKINAEYALFTLSFQSFISPGTRSVVFVSVLQIFAQQAENSKAIWHFKHRKNCECCPGHHLIVDHYSSI